MKKVFVVLLAISMILGCSSGPSEFVSEENGLKIIFPCSYENHQNYSYSCGNPVPDNSKEMAHDYVVIIKDLDEEVWSKRLEAIRSDVKDSKEYDSPSYTKNRNIKEKKIKNYKAYEDINTISDSSGVGDIKRVIFIIKNGKMIEVSAFLKRPYKMKQEDFNKIIETEFENFFNSLEIK